MHRIRNRVIVVLNRAGLPTGPIYLLTVAGRRTGVARTTPVAPIVVDGIRYLVQAYPGADWVKNARAAGRGLLRRGRHTEAVHLTEVPPEQRGALLRHFPAQNPRGVGAFVRNGLVASPAPDDFAAAADRCPMFRAEPNRAAEVSRVRGDGHPAVHHRGSASAEGWRPRRFR
ncbi:nitroreductase family deazaflavin-dependent oxidoreductase [Dactylosporangium sp. NPDC049140]|uniref:nitroreductase family deazaflavin-dependent oxidoreductase n=1 Tax=Dactylosporangium sp. NPDC049140 TaxID=3155647 RepID=UPI0033D8A97E